MFLNEIHDQLCAAEFSQMFIGEGSELNATAIPKVNTIIQAALNDLNKHFTIRENYLLLRTKLGKDTYELTPANAVSSGNPFAFIIDSVEDPFKGDIMQIINMKDSNGNSLWMNTDVAYRVPQESIYGRSPDFYTFRGINLLSYNTIKLHQNHDLGDVLVQYKAKAPKFDTTQAPDTVYLDVPDHYLNALVYFVASKWFSPKGNESVGQGMFHEGNNYTQKYINEVNELKANMGSIASMGETTAFQRGGWV